MAIDMPYSVEFSENWPWIVKLYMLVHNLSKLLVINPLTFMVEFQLELSESLWLPTLGCDIHIIEDYLSMRLRVFILEEYIRSADEQICDKHVVIFFSYFIKGQAFKGSSIHCVWTALEVLNQYHEDRQKN